MQTAWAEDPDSELLLVSLLHGTGISSCHILTVLFCCAQPELTFILVDLQKATQAPEGTGALVAGRWPRVMTVWLMAPAGIAMSLVLIVLQACVAMSTCI